MPCLRRVGLRLRRLRLRSDGKEVRRGSVVFNRQIVQRLVSRKTLDGLWSMADLAALVEAVAVKPGKRGPYRKTAAA